MASSQLEETEDKLKEIGIEEECIVTLRLCTLFLKIGVVDKKLPIGKLAALQLRDEDTGFAELSWLERLVQRCAEAVGTKCRIETDDRGDEVLVVDSGKELDVPKFEKEFEVRLNEELPSVAPLKRSG